MTDLIERLRDSRATWEDGRARPTDLEREAADAIQSRDTIIREIIAAFDSSDDFRCMAALNDARAALEKRA